MRVQVVSLNLARSAQRIRVGLRHGCGMAVVGVLNWVRTRTAEVSRSRPAVVWPPLRSRQQVSDLLPRLAWMIPRMSPPRPIILPATEALRHTDWNAVPAAHYLEWPRECKIEFQPEYDRSRFKSLLSESSLIVVWNARSLGGAALLPRLKRVAVIDPDFYFLAEYQGWARVLENTQDQELSAELEEESTRNFKQLVKEAARYETMNLFGRGPSLLEAYNHDLSGQGNIICNGIVQSERFLQHSRPFVIACIDAYHHVGPSRYAARFREDLTRAALKYKAFVVVPFEQLYLLGTQCPQLRPFLVGLKQTRERIAVPSPERPYVFPLDNVLTYAMLPASMVASPKLIQIWGCDGRAPREGGFVWRRESSVEYEGLTATAAAAHPSYFRDFVTEDYYDLHCRQLEAWLRFAEGHGVELRSCSHSYIPCLRSRYGTPTATLQSPALGSN